MKRILVARGGAIGDFVLTLPVLRALTSRFDVTVLANRKVSGLWCDAPFVLDEATVATLFVRNGEVPDELRAWIGGFDILLSYLHDQQRTFEENIRRSGVNQVTRGPAQLTEAKHATEQLAQPLAELCIPISDFVPKVEINETDAARIRERFGLTNESYVAVHAGSGSARKNWPVEKWIALCRCLRNRLLFIGGEADHAQLALLEGQFADAAFAIDLPLVEVAALLAGSIFIGHDSGISHVAAAAGASCAVLFGPTNPNVWAPRGENVRIVRAPAGDLANLSVDSVAQELMRIGIST